MGEQELNAFIRSLFDGGFFVILAKATMLAVLARVVVPAVMWIRGKSNGGTAPEKLLAKLDKMLLYQKRQVKMTRSMRDEARTAHASQAKASEALATAAKHNNNIAERLLTIVEDLRRIGNHNGD